MSENCVVQSIALNCHSIPLNETNQLSQTISIRKWEVGSPKPEVVGRASVSHCGRRIFRRVRVILPLDRKWCPQVETSDLFLFAFVVDTQTVACSIPFQFGIGDAFVCIHIGRIHIICLVMW